MGNPPFVGARWMSQEQKSDLFNVFGKDWKNSGDLDYVSCWYKKSVDFINQTNISVALVSTNSICQGGSVTNLWKPLFEKGIHINFAYRTFKWDSESNSKAHVHCIIVGFSFNKINGKKKWDYGLYNWKQRISFKASRKYHYTKQNTYGRNCRKVGRIIFW